METLAIAFVPAVIGSMAVIFVMVVGLVGGTQPLAGPQAGVPTSGPAGSVEHDPLA